MSPLLNGAARAKPWDVDYPCSAARDGVLPRPLRRSLLAFAATISLALTASCLAPTLPVPPPIDPEASAPDTSGMVTVKGGKNSVEPSAEVQVVNFSLKLRCESATPPTNCNYGAFRDAAKDGSWTVAVAGQSKDDL